MRHCTHRRNGEREAQFYYPICAVLAHCTVAFPFRAHLNHCLQTKVQTLAQKFWGTEIRTLDLFTSGKTDNEGAGICLVSDVFFKFEIWVVWIMKTVLGHVAVAWTINTHKHYGRIWRPLPQLGLKGMHAITSAFLIGPRVVWIPTRSLMRHSRNLSAELKSPTL